MMVNRSSRFASASGHPDSAASPQKKKYARRIAGLLRRAFEEELGAPPRLGTLGFIRRPAREKLDRSDWETYGFAAMRSRDTR